MKIPSRLLVLDDDPVMREIIAAVAEQQGFESRGAACPAEFDTELANWDPTHITIDLAMPGKDGIEVLCELGAVHCRASIVIISSMGSRIVESARQIARERNLHVSGVLTKPFSFGALEALLGTPQPPRGIPRPVDADRSELIFTPRVLEEALAEDQFVLHFQPVVELASGRIAGVEALVRWQHPVLGLVLPGRFIASLERSGCIGPLTEWVVDQAMAWLADSGLPRETWIAINLSAPDLGDIALADRLHGRCMHHGIGTERVVLDLAESSTQADPETALATTTRLRIKGFGVAIDHFGSGKSSLMQLARIPSSSIKIDRSFLASHTRSTESQIVVRSIIGLGHALGLPLIAEGVESVQTARSLRSRGCDLAQGYAIAPPMDAPAFGPWLKGWNPERFLSGEGTIDEFPRPDPGPPDSTAAVGPAHRDGTSTTS